MKKHISNIAQAITYRSLLPIGIILAITAMITTLTIGFSEIQANSKQMYASTEHHNHTNELLRTLTEVTFNRSVLLLELVETSDHIRQDEIYIKLNELATIYTAARARLLEQNLSENQHMLLEHQSQNLKSLLQLNHQIVDLVISGENKAAKTLFNQTVQLRYYNIHNLEKLASHQYEASKGTFIEFKKNNNESIAIIIWVGISSILVCFLLIILFVKTQYKNNKKLSILASTDSLTGLANRPNLIRKIKSTIKKAPSDCFAIVFLDIDYFKSINDNYGHEAGDRILKLFTHTITKMIDDTDVLSRLGGDEFVLLLKSKKTLKDIKLFVDFLSTTLDTSFSVNNQEIFISSSIGVSVYPKHGDDVTALLRFADTAMYYAKDAGRNCVQFYSKKTEQQRERDHKINHALHTILNDNNDKEQLYLKYQPLLDVSTGEISECEALLRWKTPNGKNIPADDFIPLAEKTNIIEKLNIYVIDRACEQQLVWQKLNIKMRVNINLCGNKRVFNNLLTRLTGKIEELNLDPKLFGIELTERTIMDVSEETIQDLRDIRSMGMKISIDDFGTGYSSLSYLKKLPITTIKIDKEFITDLPHDKDDYELVKTIITLGHSLNLDVVAEGVETIEQLDFLKQYSCDIAQGFYLHRPLTNEQLMLLDEVA